MEIETPVLLAYAIKDFTDIFRISGGGLNTPNPPSRYATALYVAQVFSEWFWNDSKCFYYYRYHFVFTTQMCCISIIQSLHFTIFLPSYLITFLCAEIATSIDTMFFYSLAQAVMSTSLLEMVLLVCTCWFYNMVPLPSKLVSTKCDTHSYQFSLSSLPLFLAYVKVSCSTLSDMSLSCIVLLPAHCKLIWCVLSSRQTVHTVHICYQCLSVCNIFVARYSVCNAWSCAEITVLSVSPVKSSLGRQRKGSSSITSCLSALAVVCCCLPFLCHRYHSICLTLLKLLLLF